MCLNGGSLIIGVNIGRAGSKRCSYLSGSFFTDITTLPDEFLTNVGAAGVDFVSVFDDDDADDADRMMTTVFEVASLLLLLLTDVARRPVFSDVPRLHADFTAGLLLMVIAGCDLPVTTLVLITTTRLAVLVGLANDTVADLATRTSDGLFSNTEVFRNTVGLFPATVGGPSTLLSPRCAAC